MPYDTTLAERIERQFEARGIAFVAKPMMGGLAFMVDDKMCVGVYQNQLLVRLDPAEIAVALKQTGCRPMTFTGRTMKSFVLVTSDDIRRAAALSRWMERALAYNPRAVRSARSARSKRK